MAAAGQQQQQPSPAQQFSAMQANADICLQLLRGLRASVLKSLTLAAAGPQGDGSAEADSAYLNRVQVHLNHVNQRYEELEAAAKQLPQATPISLPIEKLNRLLQDGQLDLHTDQLYRRLVETTNWIDANNHLLGYYCEFLRGVGRRRPCAFVPRALAFSTCETLAHHAFTQYFTSLINDMQVKRSGVQARFLEKLPLAAIVELKYGQYTEKQFVCNMKMALLVCNGNIEMFQIIASHEDWVYLDGARQQHVDMFAESKYLVYRKMSAHVNAMTSTIAITLTAPSIGEQLAKNWPMLLSVFAKMAQIMDTKCRVCQKILKDYLPPLQFDWRNVRTAVHDSCR